MYLLIILIVICTLAYFKLINPYSYWRKRDIFYVHSWSKILHMIWSKESFVDVVIEAYRAFPNRRYYGSFQFLQPSLMVRDLDLIKKITVKDFDHFTDHFGFVIDDPIFGKNLFSLNGQEWKELRSTLSPAFTSSKMRAMFTLMVDNAENFANYFLNQPNQDVMVLEMREVFSKFTNDVIANCAFGVKCNSLRDPNNEFMKMGNLLASPSKLSAIGLMLYGFLYKLFAFFKISMFDGRISEFFRHLVKETITTREKQGIIRPDMIHLLMEARKGRLKHDNEHTSTEVGFDTPQESEHGKSSNIEITDDLITSQAVVFFLAGFSTSSAFMSFIAFELATNPECQEKLQREIDETLDLSKGRLIYEHVSEMKYLDQVVTETLRKWPPAFVLNRVCVKDYVIPAKNNDEKTILLEKGCLVSIPLVGIHMDPDYFPDPHIFNPDRFSDENKASIVPGSYLPFGAGPRNCIGSRFALLEAKALMVSLLSKFEIVTVRETIIPIKLRKSITTEADGGIWLGLKRRIES